MKSAASARVHTKTELTSSRLFDIILIANRKKGQAMISRNTNFTDTELPDQIILETVCPFCGKERRLTLKGSKVAYEAGDKIQDAFPSFTPSEREFILTGICDECWDSM